MRIDVSLKVGSDGLRCIPQTADIQKGFVNRQLLDKRRQVVEDRHDLLRRFFIGGEVRGDDFQLRARLHGLTHWHRRVNPEFSGGNVGTALRKA